MSIIISQDGKNAQKIDKSEIEKEDYLQNYIHNNPEAIPIYELKEDKKLLVLKREFNTNAGPIDALAIDKDGDIYIVETKLYKNPDKRTVVAQALDYGAALWRHFNDFNKFTQILNQEIESKFKISLEDKIKEFYNLDDEGLSFVLERLKDNLNDGNIKFVILMDSIDERLKDLILYVNQNSQFDIYAVQLEYYKFKQYEIMIPKIFGVEVKKNITSSQYSPRKHWDETSFINQTKESLGEDSQKILEIYNFFKNNNEKINWGTGIKAGSFSPIINKIHNTISPFTFYSNGKFEAKFNWIFDQTKKEEVRNKADIFFKNLANKKISINNDVFQLKETFRLQKNEFLSNSKNIFEAIKKVMND